MDTTNGNKPLFANERKFTVDDLENLHNIEVIMLDQMIMGVKTVAGYIPDPKVSIEGVKKMFPSGEIDHLLPAAYDMAFTAFKLITGKQGEAVLSETTKLEAEITRLTTEYASASKAIIELQKKYDALKETVTKDAAEITDEQPSLCPDDILVDTKKIVKGTRRQDIKQTKEQLEAEFKDLAKQFAAIYKAKKRKDKEV